MDRLGLGNVVDPQKNEQIIMGRNIEVWNKTEAEKEIHIEEEHEADKKHHRSEDFGKKE